MTPIPRASMLCSLLTAGLAVGCSTDAGTDPEASTGDASSTTDEGTAEPTVATQGTVDGSGDVSSSGAPTPPPVTEGEFSVLAYNVAGLPDGVSQSMPIEYLPQVSPLLNLYDLALVQEDFAYHDLLVADAMHPYISEPHPDSDPRALRFGDGLNEFSQFPFGPLDRVTWAQCHGTTGNGSDCLTTKGFYAATHTVAEGVEVDVYNLHMDAGGSAQDIAARDAQVAQLVMHIAANAGARAIIVAGDTNMDEEDEASFVALVEGAGLVDACRALACGDEYRIDRVLVRSSDSVVLQPVAWTIDERFVDPEGNPLSDHEAVGVTIEWRWTGG